MNNPPLNISITQIDNAWIVGKAPRQFSQTEVEPPVAVACQDLESVIAVIKSMWPKENGEMGNVLSLHKRGSGSNLVTPE
jgi:hypothetical protein